MEHENQNAEALNQGGRENEICDNISLETNPLKRKIELRNDNEKETNMLIQTSRKSMVDEVQCSICMDIIVKASISNPCGHIFCFSCLSNAMRKSKDCPVCRTAIESTTTSAALDNIIFGMAMRGDFQVDDLTYYLQRSGTKLARKEVNNNREVFFLQLLKIYYTCSLSSFLIMDHAKIKMVKNLSIRNSSESATNPPKIRRMDPSPNSYFPIYVLDRMQGTTTFNQPLLSGERGGGQSSDDAIVID